MKYFTKEVKIALTAIAALALCYYVINFLKGINVFASSNTYYVEFSNIEGLTVSNSVFSNGYAVGIVRDIEYDYKNKSTVVTAIELKENMRIPRGTVAELNTSLMGGVTMNLILGPNPSDVIQQGDTIKGRPHYGAVAQAQKALPDLVALIPKLDSILVGLNRVAQDTALVQIVKNMAKVTNHMASMTKNVDRMMESDIPMIMKNLNVTTEHLAKVSRELDNSRLHQMVTNSDTTLERLKQTGDQLNMLSAHLNSQLHASDNTLGLLLNDRGIYDQLDTTIGNVDSLMRDLRLHPKRYVHFSVFGKKTK